ncbi:hypothetical protein [Aeromonas sp. Marseille-Q7275]
METETPLPMQAELESQVHIHSSCALARLKALNMTSEILLKETTELLRDRRAVMTSKPCMAISVIASRRARLTPSRAPDGDPVKHGRHIIPEPCISVFFRQFAGLNALPDALNDALIRSGGNRPAMP